MASSRVLALLVLVCGSLTAGCTAAPTNNAADATNSVSSTHSLSVSAISPTPTPTASTAKPTHSATPTPTPTHSTVSAIAPLSAAARAAGLIDIRTIIPDAIIDLRYATTNNFTHVRLYPTDARCLVHQSMAAGLTTAAAALRRQGELIVFWDCYRPHGVQVRMFDIVSDPNWVARPGPLARSHEAARSVDVSLASARTTADCAVGQRVQSHCLLDMGTGFDDFTARAHAYATDGVTAQAQANRALLRNAMAQGGITVYSGEWWHFDGPDADVGRPYLNAPVD